MTEFSLSMDPRWIGPIEYGEKTSTTRLERKCEVGDIFELNGRGYVVRRILSLPLWDAVGHYYATEGFRTPEEFRDALRGYYPEADDDTRAYIHFFEEAVE